MTKRVALVTGAGQGIGRAIAVRLGRDGYHVVVNDLVAQSAASTAREISEAGGKAVEMACDVADVQATTALVEQIVAECGHLDALVSNAGLIQPNLFGQVTEHDWDKTFSVNARGLFFLMQVAAREMLSLGGGSIVNMASIVGRGAPTTSPPYAASKAAVISLTQSAARALAPHGVRVNAVCPGMIDTPFNWALDQRFGVEGQGLDKGEYLRHRLAGVPMAKMGQPQEVASVVAFLLSDEASYITGQSINIDGGILFN